MRHVALLITAVVVAGCSVTSNQGQPLTPMPSSTPSTPSSTTPSATTTSSTRAPAPTSAAPDAAIPADDATITEVIAWVKAAPAAAVIDFDTVTRDGTVTNLGDEVAFSTQTPKLQCVTESRFGAADLACLVALTDPPPQPTPERPGNWKGNWVNFPGAEVTVGGLHGDPGRFNDGQGATLDRGQSLRFGDYQCRAGETDVFCVNLAHQTAVRLGPTGVHPYGCLKPTDPVADEAVRYACF